MARFERDHLRVDPWLLDTDPAQQLRKPPPRLAAQAGEDLGDRSRVRRWL
jgi:hypothetical protein